jgi:hypothetical protein
MHQDFDPRDLEPMPPHRERRSRGLPFKLPSFSVGIAPIAVAATAVLGFGGIVWWALGQNGKTADSGDQPPVIKADGSDIRRKPSDPGGLVVPNQDKFVLNQSGANPQSVERLLPGPEAPLPKSALPPPPVAAQAPVGAIAQGPAGLVAPPPPVASGPAVAGTTQPAPRAVSTQPATSTQTAVLPPPNPATPAPMGAPATAQSSAMGAGFRVQLAAVRNSEVAAAEWTRMQRNFPELASLRMTAVPVDIEGRPPFVRIQAGPFPSLAAAQKICADLKARSQGCLVVRP